MMGLFELSGVLTTTIRDERNGDERNRDERNRTNATGMNATLYYHMHLPALHIYFWITISSQIASHPHLHI